MNINVNELKSWIGNEENTFDEVTKSQSFVDEFNVNVDFDVSGGWGTIMILISVELIFVYLILANRTN